MALDANGTGRRVIDLTSDDDEEIPRAEPRPDAGLIGDGLGNNQYVDDFLANAFPDYPPYPWEDLIANPRLSPALLHGNEPADPVDLDAWEALPFAPDASPPQPVEPEAFALTEEESLQAILNVIPDVSVKHVLWHIRGNARNAAACERIITELFDDGYPKENDESNQRKRKREDDGDDNAEFAVGRSEPGYTMHA